MLSMFGCCVTLISEKPPKGHWSSDANKYTLCKLFFFFFGDESLFIAVNERHGGQLSLPVQS